MKFKCKRPGKCYTTFLLASQLLNCLCHSAECVRDDIELGAEHGDKVRVAGGVCPSAFRSLSSQATSDWNLDDGIQGSRGAGDGRSTSRVILGLRVGVRKVDDLGDRTLAAFFRRGNRLLFDPNASSFLSTHGTRARAFGCY